jgi:uncharacterized damage-inducible protein DinB
MTIKDTLLMEFDHEMAATRKLIERLPDDKLAWKPHAKSYSLGGLATHLANLPLWAGSILNEDSFDLAVELPRNTEITSRAELLATFDTNSKRARGWMGKTDAEYSGRWSLKRAGQELFSMPRAVAFRSFVVNHMIHHRGQMTVYLRLNDVPLPAIYGPTADEGN